MPRQFAHSQVSTYLAHRQHLLSSARLDDPLQVTHDLVALHGTEPVTPYLSLWARAASFQRVHLEDALYEQRSLVRVLCMRATIHLVPSTELPYFFQAYAGGPDAGYRRMLPPELLVLAGLCCEADASTRKAAFEQEVLGYLAGHGPASTAEIVQAVPALAAKYHYDVGKPSEGDFSIGSGVIRDLCAQGLLVRGRPRGTWRSNLHEYALHAAWLPDVDLKSVVWREAQAWLVARYVSTFGPVTASDIQWWTGFSQSDTLLALKALSAQTTTIELEGQPGDCVMLQPDAEVLASTGMPEYSYAALLPTLDPLIMGYQNRDRFLVPAQRNKVFDRAGNAMPTVWVDGRVVGVWRQRRDASVVTGLFEPVSSAGQAALTAEARRLEAFLHGEVLMPRSMTPFLRDLV